MLGTNLAYPSTPQSADVPSLEEKVRKMIEEDLAVSILSALFVKFRFCLSAFSNFFSF